ncbi:hypothetical protein K7432_003287 [Basidiobolus ranarum]|uniref:magnesium chelatase n=1 Tax=Basidiobolus ranarum TaxID=34480 RepID=A0ABR2W6L3_9FUNG
MKQPRGRYRQRIQAICRGPGSQYSEDVLMSILLCLITGSKPLLLKTHPETLQELSDMLVQMSQEVFGLTCARINCSQLDSPTDLYDTMFNKSKDAILRPRAASLARTNTPMSGLVPPSGFILGSKPSNLDPLVKKGMSINREPTEKKYRSFSADDRSPEDRKTLLSVLGHRVPTERFSGRTHNDRQSKNNITVSFREYLENPPAKPDSLNDQHFKPVKQYGDPETIPLQRLDNRNSKDTLASKPLRKSSTIYSSRIFNPSKKLANIVIVEGLDAANDTIQCAISEILSKGSFVDCNTLCHVPDPFVIIAVVPLSSTMLKSKHLLDKFYLNYTYEGGIEAKSLLQSKRYFAFPYQEVKDISQRARNVIVNPEINRYLRDILTAIRTNLRFKTGATARASTDLVSAVRALAAIYEKTHVTPDLVLIILSKVLGHRLFPLNDSIKAQSSSDQGIISDVLQSVWPPS